jgi:hypothetical protein
MTVKYHQDFHNTFSVTLDLLILLSNQQEIFKFQQLKGTLFSSWRAEIFEPPKLILSNTVDITLFQEHTFHKKFHF